MSSRLFERIYPYAIPLIGAAGAMHYEVSFPTGNDVFGASITMGSIFIGFLATAKSILLGLQTEGFKTIRKTKFFPLLICYLKEAIYASLLYCCACLAAFFVMQRNHWEVAAWIYLTGVTLLSFLRVVRVFMVLVAQPTE